MQTTIAFLLSDDQTLLAIAEHAQRKAALVHGYQPGAVRSVYWSFNLTRDLEYAPFFQYSYKNDRVQWLAGDLSRSLARDLDFGLTTAIGIDIDITSDITRDLDLARGLSELGVEQSESNLRSKVNNGSLGAQLFVYILLALDQKTLELAQVEEILAELGDGAPGSQTEDEA